MCMGPVHWRERRGALLVLVGQSMSLKQCMLPGRQRLRMWADVLPVPSPPLLLRDDPHLRVFNLRVFKPRVCFKLNSFPLLRRHVLK